MAVFGLESESKESADPQGSHFKAYHSTGFLSKECMMNCMCMCLLVPVCMCASGVCLCMGLPAPKDLICNVITCSLSLRFLFPPPLLDLFSTVAHSQTNSRDLRINQQNKQFFPYDLRHGSRSTKYLNRPAGGVSCHHFSSHAILIST